MLPQFPGQLSAGGPNHPLPTGIEILAGPLMQTGLVALAILPLLLAFSLAADIAVAMPAVFALMALPAGRCAASGRHGLSVLFALTFVLALITHAFAAAHLYSGSVAVIANVVIGAGLLTLPLVIGLAGWMRPGGKRPVDVALSGAIAGADESLCFETLTAGRAVVIFDRDFRCDQYNQSASDRFVLASGHKDRDFLSHIAVFDRPTLLNALLGVERGAAPAPVQLRLADPAHPLAGRHVMSVTIETYGGDRFMMTIHDDPPDSIETIFSPIGIEPGHQTADPDSNIVRLRETEIAGAHANASGEVAEAVTSSESISEPDTAFAGIAEPDVTGATTVYGPPAQAPEPVVTSPTPPPVLDEATVDWTMPDRAAAFTRSYSQYDPLGSQAPVPVGWQ